MKPKQSIIAILVLVMMGISFTSARAEVDEWDMSYGDGFAAFIYQYGSGGGSIAVMPDGKVYMSGLLNDEFGDPDQGIIIRFDSTGEVDTAFADAGFATGLSGAGDLALQPDGKILLASVTQDVDDYSDIAIQRLNSDGSVDASFGLDGTYRYGTETDDLFASGVAIQADGKIVVCGFGQDDLLEGVEMLIFRLNSNGTLDNTFNSGSIYFYEEGISAGYSLVIQNDGKILVAGVASSDEYSHMAIWRFTTTGELDSTFGSGGIVIDANARGDLDDYDSASDILVQGDGKIVVVGQSGQMGENRDMFLWRYNTDGTLDTSFGTNGRAHFSNTGGSKIDLIGEKYMVSGYTFGSGPLYLWRYNANGTLDTTFNDVGYLTHHDSVNYVRESSAGMVVYGNNAVFLGISCTAHDELSVDIGVVKAKLSYQIAGLPVGLQLTDADGNSIEAGSSNGLAGPTVVYIRDTMGNMIGSVIVDLSQDVNWSGVTGNTDLAGYKSVITGLSGASGASSTHSLYVPKRAQDTSVTICPGATSLTEVTANCPGKLVKNIGDSNVSLVTVGNVTYWKVDGLTGTGGVSGSQELLERTGSDVRGLIFPGVVLFLVTFLDIVNRNKQRQY